MSADVVRLPVQHPEHPHCPGCGKALPCFDGGINLTWEEAKAVKLEAVSYHVACTCGRKLTLTRQVTRVD